MISYSQSGQDLWVNSIFKDSTNLFFLDVGANDGITDSNTYLLEKNGWNGICIEGSKVSFEKLKKVRSCKLLNCVISNFTGTCGFIENGNDLISKMDRGGTEYPVVTFQDIELPKNIDYLSIDIEGEEFNALSKFPFNTHRVKVITVEHNLYATNAIQKDKIYKLLTSKGFIRVKDNVCVVKNTYPFEDWYVHSSFHA